MSVTTIPNEKVYLSRQRINDNFADVDGKIQSTTNAAAAGLAELFTQIGGVSSFTASQIATMQGQIAALVAVLDPNVISAALMELCALVGMVPDSVWRCETGADGGLILPLSLRVNGRAIVSVPTTAPLDADIPNGYMAPWLNEATEKLTFRIRRSNGALITKEI